MAQITIEELYHGEHINIPSKVTNLLDFRALKIGFTIILPFLGSNLHKQR